MRKKPVVAVIAAIVLVVSVVSIVRYARDTGLPEPGQADWFDMGTGELYGGLKMGEAVPPITLPSGNQGVLAHVFARGSCENQDDRFIGFLCKYTDKGKAMLVEAKARGGVDRGTATRVAMRERLIKRPGDKEWVIASSDEGEAILAPTREKGVAVCLGSAD